MSKLQEIISLIVFSGILLFIGYFPISLILYGNVVIPFAKTEDELIERRALRRTDLKDKEYIICKYVATTGYNFELIQDENGKRTPWFIVKRLCRVTGSGFVGAVTYDFLISGNSIIFYVVEKKQYYDPDMMENVIEYVVDGWDVLYPVKRDTMFNAAPKYVLKSDLNDMD